jgi:hypothetical protein
MRACKNIKIYRLEAEIIAIITDTFLCFAYLKVIAIISASGQ